jgi:hypothetical protein
MFESVTKTESRWKFLWPDVSYLAGAEDGIKLGYWGAFLVAGLTTVVSLLQVMGANLWSLLDAGVFALVGLGIWRKWRSAAVVGLILFTGNLIISLTRGLGLSILAIFVFFGLVAAVRGTFAYHRLMRNAKAAGTQGGAPA